MLHLLVANLITLQIVVFSCRWLCTASYLTEMFRSKKSHRLDVIRIEKSLTLIFNGKSQNCSNPILGGLFFLHPSPLACWVTNIIIISPYFSMRGEKEEAQVAWVAAWFLPATLCPENTWQRNNCQNFASGVQTLSKVVSALQIFCRAFLRLWYWV